MSHKDWKGPGVYECWDWNKVWQMTDMKSASASMCGSWHYEKLENFTPPKPPEEELPDGLYLIQGSHHPFHALKKDGKWIPCVCALRMNDPETPDLSSVICRIPTEPI